MAGIVIRGLSKSFGAGGASFAAVADLDLDIADSSFVTLLGPSGCGKTTMLRLIAGYITPDRGSIEVDSRPLSTPDAVVPPERHVDPSGGRRDGCRAPIPWTPAPDHGWTGADPWLPFPPQPDVRNVASLRTDPVSILHLYRALLAARRASPALQLGSLELLGTSEDVLVLDGYGLDTATPRIGRRLELKLRWRPIRPLLPGLGLSVELRPASGSVSMTIRGVTIDP